MSWWEFWRKEKLKTDFVQSYLDLNAEKIPGIRGLGQLNFTVLDTETTGLDPVRDAVLSFGAVKIHQSKICIAQATEWYPYSEKSGINTIAIHGLMDGKNTLPKEEFARRFLLYIGNDILVGHHIRFDLEILKNMLIPYGFIHFKNPVLDTYFLAIRLEEGPLRDLSAFRHEDYSLDSLCKRYGIQADDRHTAAGDAFLTSLLLMKLLAKAKSKGINTFQRLID